MVRVAGQLGQVAQVFPRLLLPGVQDFCQSRGLSEECREHTLHVCLVPMGAWAQPPGVPPAAWNSSPLFNLTVQAAVFHVAPFPPSAAPACRSSASWSMRDACLNPAVDPAARCVRHAHSHHQARSHLAAYDLGGDGWRALRRAQAALVALPPLHRVGDAAARALPVGPGSVLSAVLRGMRLRLRLRRVLRRRHLQDGQRALAV